MCAFSVLTLLVGHQEVGLGLVGPPVSIMVGIGLGSVSGHMSPLDMK